MKHLVVKEPFGDYEKGRVIGDPAEIERLEKSHRHHVLPVDLPEDTIPKFLFVPDQENTAPAVDAAPRRKRNR